VFTRILVLVVFCLTTLAAPGGMAADRISFVRDAEVENAIRAFATPIFRAAGLSPESVRIHLVRDQSLNAFVAGGMRLFLNTGLLIRTEHAGQLVGVIAHETGHIVGGHLARMDEAMANATAEAIISMVLGAAAAAAAGRPDVGAGVLMGGQSMAQRSFFAYTRTQEQSADQAAVKLMDAAGLSSRGLLEFMDILGDQELLLAERQDPYVRTHPLTRDRVSFLRHHVETSARSAADVPPEFAEMHRRMRAKLFAFLEPTGRTLQRYKEDDDSIEARYARAIAWHRKPDLPKALALIDGLIAERPRDPYFHELRGQILFEHGNARDAVTSYREAVRLLPDSHLIRLSAAQVLVALEGPDDLREAIEHLEPVVRVEPRNSFAWRLLAVAHGRLGNEAMASLAMAEEALLTGRVPDANFHAGRAEQLLRKNSPAWLQAQDIKARAANIRSERER